jgi:hypothetical protein
VHVVEQVQMQVDAEEDHDRMFAASGDRLSECPDAGERS